MSFNLVQLQNYRTRRFRDRTPKFRLNIRRLPRGYSEYADGKSGLIADLKMSILLTLVNNGTMQEVISKFPECDRYATKVYSVPIYFAVLSF